MTQSNNIVTFPKNRKIASETNTIEDIQNNIDIMRQYHIQETILNVAPILFKQLDIAGFGLMEDEDEDVRDGAFIIEALKSLMYKHYDMYHPFQKIAENIFKEEPDEDGVFEIVDEIALDLRKPETEPETPTE